MSGFYWIASYPKSGNTWLRLFLESVSRGGAEFDFNSTNCLVSHGADRNAFEAALEIESGDLTVDEIMRARPRQYEIEAAPASTPLLRKVHDACLPTPAGEPLFPPAVTLGVIYLVRDPRDVLVSFAHHLGQKIDTTLRKMADPTAMLDTGRRRLSHHLPERLSSWSGHVASWLDAPGYHRLVLRYEDLLADPVQWLGRAARFLGWKPPAAQVEAAVAAVSFEKLRRAEQIHGFVESPRGTRFFRRGVAGGWRDVLTSEHLERVEADHGRVMHRLAYFT